MQFQIEQVKKGHHLKHAMKLGYNEALETGRFSSLFVIFKN